MFDCCYQLPFKLCESIRSLISRLWQRSISFEFTFAMLTVSIAFVQNYRVTLLFQIHLDMHGICLPHPVVYNIPVQNIQFWFDINTNRLCDSVGFSMPGRMSRITFSTSGSKQTMRTWMHFATVSCCFFFRISHQTPKWKWCKSKCEWDGEQYKQIFNCILTFQNCHFNWYVRYHSCIIKREIVVEPHELGMTISN